MKISKKTILVIILIVAVFIIGFFLVYLGFLRSNSQRANLVDYYGELTKKCPSAGSDCCLRSVEKMKSASLVEPIDGKCPEGKITNRYDCAGSYSWCEPVAAAEAKAVGEQQKIEEKTKICLYDDGEVLANAICNQLIVRVPTEPKDSGIKQKISELVDYFNGQVLKRELRDTYWIVAVPDREKLFAFKLALDAHKDLSVFLNIVSTVAKE